MIRHTIAWLAAGSLFAALLALSLWAEWIVPKIFN